MPITFSCPCGRQLQVGDEYAGKRARCPECDAVVTVPSADDPPPPPAKPSKRAKLVEPDESDDDAGATAGSLNPMEGRGRRSRRDEDDEDDDRPRRRRRRRDDDDEDDGDYRPIRRRLRSDPPRKLLNNRVTGGLTCLVIGSVWLCGGLAFDRLFFFPAILLVVGVVSLIIGLVTGRDE